MTFSYDPTLTQPKDQVRFLIDDTVDPGALFQDEELSGLLVMKGGDAYGAAAVAARKLAVRYGSMASITTGGTTIDVADRAAHFLALSKELEAQSNLGPAGVVGAVPIVGGTSISDMNQRQDNPDRPPDRFVVGADDGVGPEVPREYTPGGRGWSWP